MIVENVSNGLLMLLNFDSYTVLKTKREFDLVSLLRLIMINLTYEKKKKLSSVT